MHPFARILMTLLLSALPQVAPAEWLVYIGTDTSGDSRGIYVSRFDERSGALTPPQLAVAIDKPGFLTTHAGSHRLYSVAASRAPDGTLAGEVAAFAIQPDASLRLLNTQPSQGSGPCHVAVDVRGRVLLVANYTGGTVASYPLRADGSLGPAASTHQHTGASVHPQRQAGPHPHGIYPGPVPPLVYVPDLGLDKILIYRLDAASARLLPSTPGHADTEAGGGPRHLAFHPDGRHVYASLELSSRVASFRLDSATGALQGLAVHDSLPPGAPREGNTTAEIAVHPGGSFLYISNRGHDSIAVFNIDPQNGALHFIAATPTGGRTPRHFALSPDGRFLVAANQNSRNVTVFRIDPERGTLSPTGHEVNVDRPTYVKFFQQ